jgi:type III secretory pathway component EscU
VANGKANAPDPPAPAVPFRFWFWGQIFELLRSNGRTFLISATIAFCFYELSVAFRSFAGQATFASLTLRILANIVFQWSVTIAVSGISIALYLRERKQHENTRERLTERITKLEVQIDRRRSSSLLTSKGRTRKEDE